MLLADLITDYKFSLNDAIEVFITPDDVDFKRHLNRAADDLSIHFGEIYQSTLTLVAGQSSYSFMADLVKTVSYSWQSDILRKKPWESDWPGVLPVLRHTRSSAGLPFIQFSPPPTQQQLNILGADISLEFVGRYQIDPVVTVPSHLIGKLITRAQAEAMKEMSLRNVKKPVNLRDGLNSGPKNGTPSALFQMLMDDFHCR